MTAVTGVREQIVAALTHEVIAALRGSEPAAFVVTDPAGIGKTWLLGRTHDAALVANAECAWVTADKLSGRTPLSTVSRLLGGDTAVCVPCGHTHGARHPAGAGPFRDGERTRPRDPDARSVVWHPDLGRTTCRWWR
ncbi:hypothetical protein [Pseudonocardia asaccharolytica]|nr:hypothetical protein [Pseudonocardia asaccharolytica]